MNRPLTLPGRSTPSLPPALDPGSRTGDPSLRSTPLPGPRASLARLKALARRRTPAHLAPRTRARTPIARVAVPLLQRGRELGTVTWSAVLLLLACVAGGVFLSRGDLPAPTDTGLVTVLPISYWLTVGLLLTGLTLAIWGPRLDQRLAAAHTVVLVVALYGVGVVFSDFPRGHVPWRHVGVAAELAQSGRVDTSIDAYFGWPGFFALLASFTELAGLEDGQALMRWAPVANELLLLLPLLVVLRALTRDSRLVWSAVVMFYLTNWVDQDYLAPQALAFLLYVCIFGLVLTCFQPSQVRDPRYRLGPLGRAAARARHAARARVTAVDPTASAPLDPRGRPPALVLAVLLITTVVSMHQLTPFALVLAFAALALAKRTPVQGLPLLTVVVLLAWLTFGAVTYMQGNLADLLADVGDVTAAAQGGLIERIQGSAGHVLVVRARVLFALVVWGLAAAAVALRYRGGRRDTTPVLLLLSPAPLFAMQSYGGEMLLRIFMFSLPFACLLAVQLLPAARTVEGRLRAGGTFLAGALLLVPAFTLVHLGNQVIDQRSAQEVAAVRALYRLAPAGSLLVAGNENTPWRNTEYASHRHATLARLLEPDQPADAAAAEQALHERLTDHGGPAYVLLTRQQAQQERLIGRRTGPALRDVERQLLASPSFEVVFRNDDAVVLRPVTDEG